MVNLERTMMRAWRIQDHPATVTDTWDLTPYYRRIRFTAPELVADLQVFPTAWFRLWVPDLTTGKDTQRAYTFSGVDKDAGTFDADFVLHAEGAASAFAREAAPGQDVLLALTPAEPKVPAGTDSYVVAGDLTAYPAIVSFLDAIPDARFTVVIEDEHSDHDALPRPEHEYLTWHWEDPAPAGRGNALATRLRTLPPPGAGAYVWAAGERSLLKRVRAVAKDEWRLPRSQFFSQYYWTEGKAGR